MADYINRDSVLELAREYYTPALREEAVPVRAIRNIPSADVAEMRHGKWLWDGYVYDAPYMCNCCSALMDYESNYCPNCGARMDGE